MKGTQSKIKILLVSVIAVVLALSLAGCSAKKESLTIFTWEGMFSEEMLSSFTENTGIEINYVNFDTDEAMLAKLQASEGADYDFVIADDYIVEQAVEEGLIAKLDKSKIKTYGNINPIFQGQYYDPNDEYTVPCGAGIIEIVYRPSATGFEIKSYRDLWDSRLKGKVGIISNSRVVDGILLKMQGKSMNEQDISDIKGLSTELDSLVPNIRLIKDSYLNDDIVSGEIDAGLMYTSQAVQAVLTDPEIKQVYPEEGLGYGIMAGFIPSKAPNSNAAYKFIEFLNEPENAAAWYEYMGYYCTNKAAEQYIDASMKELITLPDDIDSSKMEMVENISSEADAAHEEVWTEFVNKCN